MIIIVIKNISNGTLFDTIVIKDLAIPIEFVEEAL